MYCWVMGLQARQKNKKKKHSQKKKKTNKKKENGMCMLEMVGKQRLHETKTDKGQQVTQTGHVKPKLKWCLILVKQK